MLLTHSSGHWCKPLCATFAVLKSICFKTNTFSLFTQGIEVSSASIYPFVALAWIGNTYSQLQYFEYKVGLQTNQNLNVFKMSWLKALKLYWLQRWCQITEPTEAETTQLMCLTPLFKGQLSANSWLTTSLTQMTHQCARCSFTSETQQ